MQCSTVSGVCDILIFLYHVIYTADWHIRQQVQPFNYILFSCASLSATLHLMLLSCEFVPITCDETWVHHYTPESKRSSMQWKHVSSPSPKKFKMQPSAGKIMACVFWDTQGVVLVDFVPPGHTMNADDYCTLLSDRLRLAVRRKRPGLLKKCVILQHDNAPPHRARQTVDKIEKMGWELLQHPPYSPDLVPSYFHLFIY